MKPIATPTASALDARLMYASQCAYLIREAGLLQPDEASPYFERAGFLRPPATFVAGPKKINACLVGTTVDGVVLAFRGSLGLTTPSVPALLDWINHFNAELIAAKDMPGRVHAGFLGSLDTLWEDIQAEVTKQLAHAGPGARLLITGHSKGGSIATLAAFRFHRAGLTPTVATFAAPKTGDREFAQAYNAVLQNTRYEHADDIVPHLPLSANFLGMLTALPLVDRRFGELPRFDYEHVGTLRFINWSGQLVPHSPVLGAERFLNLAKMLVTMQFQQIIADHCLTSGYECTLPTCADAVPA
jgi:hypothetical protein